MITLDEKLKRLPEKPGVYIMKDEYDEIIYVGKAINLKNRVRQYFQSSKSHTSKVIAMVQRICDFEYIITDSELEALILECNLIKKHRPRFNIMLKDDKHYPYIKVTMNEDYPRIFVTRDIKKDGARYFGPYTDSNAVHKTIELIKKLFQVRNCNKNISRIMGKERACLNYHIGRCLAPCQGNISIEVYKDMMKSICLFLDGKSDELIKSLYEKMSVASDNLDFEKAAEYRDQINAIEKVNEKQRMISSALLDQDVIAFAKDSDETCVQVFFIRGGKLIGREHFFLTGTDDANSNKDILTSFIKQFYTDSPFIPREIILQEEIDEINIIESWLQSKKGTKVNIVIPKRGEKHKLIELVCKNAEETLKLFMDKSKNEYEKTVGAAKTLASILSIDNDLERIEAYDISNIKGVDSVGSMIVFESGKANTKQYRRFKIKSVEGQNDYESMREIVERRIIHGFEEMEKLKNEGKDIKEGKFSKFPDLFMIDGGLGHVNSVMPILQKHNLKIPVCGIVKDDRHRTRGLIYKGEEIIIKKDTNVFRLISAIQDEAHRFAITYHKSLRAKKTIESELDKIPSIGSTRKKALIMHFGSFDKIKKASIDELCKVQGISEKLAAIIFHYFNS